MVSMATAQNTMSTLPQARPSNPPEFLIKLKQMLEEEDAVLIRWNGGKIYIKDPLALEKKMSAYFRHSNFSSFQRQLNNFGFRKVEGKGRFASCMYMHQELEGEPPNSILRIRRKVPAPNTQKVNKQSALSVKQDRDTNDFMSSSMRTSAQKRRRITPSLPSIHHGTAADYQFSPEDDFSIPSARTSNDKTAISVKASAIRRPSLTRDHSLDDIMASALTTDSYRALLPHVGDILGGNSNITPAPASSNSESDVLLSFLEKESASMPQTSTLFSDQIFSNENSLDQSSPTVGESFAPVNIFGKTHHLNKAPRLCDPNHFVGP